MFTSVMADVPKTCFGCLSVISGKHYRQLNSEISREQYQDIFRNIGISPKGFICSPCTNKLNRLRNIDDRKKKHFLKKLMMKEKIYLSKFFYCRVLQTYVKVCRRSRTQLQLVHALFISSFVF